MEEKLMKMIEEYEPHAFIISYEPRKFKGGYLLKAMKKTKKKHKANSFQQAETSRNQMESRLHLIKSSHLRYALRWGSITLKPIKD